MEKFIYYNELYLQYKDLLNVKNRDIFDLYYGDNLTMQEIADIKGISKARVGVIIKSVEKKLESYEKVLKIRKKEQELKDLLTINDIKRIKERLEEIIKGE